MVFFVGVMWVGMFFQFIGDNQTMPIQIIYLN